MPCKNEGVCELDSTTNLNYKCICKNKFYGKNCEYTFLDSTIFLNSTILTNELSKSLINLTGLSSSNWNLVYQSSRHGFSSFDFHEKANDVLNTLTLIKTRLGAVFGGYTTQDWSGNGYKQDKNALVFSLVNGYNKPVLLNVSSNAQDKFYSILANPNNGPTFGQQFGGNVFTTSDSYQIMSGNSFLNCQYQPIGIFNYICPSSFLTKNTNFDIYEIEVYSINRNF